MRMFVIATSIDYQALQKFCVLDSKHTSKMPSLHAMWLWPLNVWREHVLINNRTAQLDSFVIDKFTDTLNAGLELNEKNVCIVSCARLSECVRLIH